MCPGPLGCYRACGIWGAGVCWRARGLRVCCCASEYVRTKDTTPPCHGAVCRYGGCAACVMWVGVCARIVCTRLQPDGRCGWWPWVRLGRLQDERLWYRGCAHKSHLVWRFVEAILFPFFLGFFLPFRALVSPAPFERFCLVFASFYWFHHNTPHSHTCYSTYYSNCPCSR